MAPITGGLLDRLALVPAPWLLGTALAVFAALSILAMAGDSPTFDEGIHLSAAYTALIERDFRLVVEHPPLGRRLAALPLLFQDVRLPSDPVAWDRSDHWPYAFKFLYQCGNDPDAMVLSGRLAMLFWGLLVVASVYAWARDIYGPKGGVIALLLAAFNPLLLAHGHLVTTDVPVTALFFLAVVAFHRWLRKRDLFYCLAAGVLLGGALASKLSAVLLLPVMGALIVAYAAARGREGDWRRRCLDLLAMGTVAWIVLWGAYGFRFATSPEPTVFAESTQGWIGFFLDHRLLPEAYLRGWAFLARHSSEGHATYALGQLSMTGWAWYFPFALAVKIPVSAWLLIGGGMAAWIRGRSKDPVTADALLAPVAIVLLVAMAGDIQIGVRHVLPAIPFLVVAAGTVGGFERRWVKVGLPVLLAASCAGPIASAPHFLGYFNLPARLLSERHRLLVDSNLDWGQDLARLKAYMDGNGISSVKLGYFGSASPRHVGLRHERLPGHNEYQHHEPEWPAATGFAPGDYVAVSATVRVGLYLKHPKFYDVHLGGLRPMKVVGSSILLYRIPKAGQ